MILFPAIDLKDGQCVRLVWATWTRRPSTTPIPPPRRKPSRTQGFEWLHVVDLNGAFEGKSVNGAAVEAILKATNNPVQLGGGIRTLAHIESWLDKGLARVILGTVAVRDPDLVIEACRRFPGQDCRRHRRQGRQGGRRRLGGSLRARRDRAGEEIRGRGRCRDHLHRYRPRRHSDRHQLGVDHRTGRAVSIPVIASGGLASIADIVRMTMPDAEKLEGAISGRALYDGRIDPDEALAVFESR
jgi:phosphoribosylformimino-5-aminoimidazole carboxamide ribotide isomerase